ncbi:hypothetical protein [Hyphobacterium marinum]|uniref:Uncharacterized protein n=1 Tax=Hyphobacterium marinum TaxID=3116574 RepID=A0ABU7LW29_9PROT|nr:hypothetical protein [Hyphobacterium sp. Y6023]MEE2565769.1 hypothetical protein [Hyphobacterium sp. Y6023]
MAVLSLVAVCLAGGADAQEANAGLPPQSIYPGDCGVFFWTRAEPNAFIAFANRTRGDARIWLDGAIVDFTVPVSATPEGRVGEQIAYTIPAAGARLEGEITEQRGDEFVLSRAFLRQTLADGSEPVTPLVGLAACRIPSAP